MTNGGPVLKKEEAEPIRSKLAVSQADLDIAQKDITALRQYSAGVLTADAKARMAEVAAIMKSSGKAQNYNTAWFGEQAMKALGKDRLDIAMMAITIGLGNGMPKLTKEDQAQVAAVVSMEQLPGEAALRKLTLRLEIGIMRADAEDNARALGAGAAARISRTAEEAKKLLDKGDIEGAESLISMGRTYSLLALSIRNWAGRSLMEEALDAGKNGSLKFQQAMDEFRLQGRITTFISLQMKQNEVDIRMAGRFGPVVNCLKLADESFDKALKAAQAGDFKGARDAYTDGIRQKAVALAMYSEVVTYDIIDLERGLGAMSGMAERMKKESQGLKIFRGLGENYLDAAGEDRFGVRRLGNYEQLNARLFDLVAGRMPASQAAAEEKARVMVRINNGISIVNQAVFGIAPLGASVTDKEKMDVRKAQDTIFKLVALNSSGWIDKNRLDQAASTANGMLRISKEYQMASAFFNYAGGMLLFPLGPIMGLPMALPLAGTAVFGTMSLENIMEEYRQTGDVTLQSLIWGGISLMPLAGIYAGTLQPVRIALAGVMIGATGWSLGNTVVAYNAAIRETDPEKRHDLWVNAVYSTLYLLPAALMLPAAYRSATGIMERAGTALDGVLQEVVPIPPLSVLETTMRGAVLVRPGLPEGQGPKGPFSPLGPLETGRPGVRVETEGSTVNVNVQQQRRFQVTEAFKLMGSKIREFRARKEANKLEPPNMDEFMAAAGQDMGRMMGENAPETQQTMANAMKSLYNSIKEKKDAATCREAMTSVYATSRSGLEAIAKGNPAQGVKGDAELAEALGYIRPMIQKTYRTTAEMEEHLKTIAEETRVDGMPKAQMETVVTSMERYTVERGGQPLAATQLLTGELTLPEREAMLVSLSTKTMKVGTGRKAKEVPIADGTMLLQEYRAVRFIKTQKDVEAIQTAGDKVKDQIKANLAIAALTEKDIDAAVFAAMKNKNVIDLYRKTYGRERGDAYAQAVEGGLEGMLDENGVPLKGPLKGRFALSADEREFIKGLRENAALAEDVQATSTLWKGSRDVSQARARELERGAELDESKTVFGLAWDLTKLGLKAGFVDFQSFGPRYLIANRGSKELFGSTMLRAAALPKNLPTVLAQTAVWWLEWRQLVWGAPYVGVRTWVNAITQAPSVEQGRADAKRDFGVDISRENAIFIRSKAGQDFYVLGISKWFPAGVERRPPKPATLKEMLETPGIVIEPTRLNAILDDARAMEEDLGKLNRLLKAVQYDKDKKPIPNDKNYADLTTLLGDMKIDAGKAWEQYISKGKELDMADMAELRRNDWLAKGYMYGLKEVVANALCSDGAVGEDVRTLDPERINSVLKLKDKNLRDASLQPILQGVNLTLADLNTLLKAKGRDTLLAKDMPELAEVARLNSAKFLSQNPEAFRTIWDMMYEGNLPLAWLGKAIVTLNRPGALDGPMAMAKGDTDEAWMSSFKGLVAGKLEGIYLSTPIAYDSFLMRLDERAVTDAGFRKTFWKLLDNYANNDRALTNFSRCVLKPDEEIYGDVTALASAIAVSGSSALAEARRNGTVTPKVLVDIDPTIRDNAALIELIRGKSTKDSNGALLVNAGMYAWIVNNRDNLKGHLTEVLTELKDNALITDVRGGQEAKIYNPKDKKGILTADMEEYFRGRGLFGPARPEGFWPPTGAKIARGAAGVAEWTWKTGTGLGKWAVVPPKKPSKTEAAKTKAEALQAKAREEELKGRYPRPAGGGPGAGATTTEAKYKAPEISGVLSQEAQKFYASDAGADLNTILGPGQMDANAGAKQKVFEMLTSDAEAAVNVRANGTITVSGSGAGMTVVIGDWDLAKRWLNVYLRSGL